MIRTTNIPAPKDRLSASLRDIQRAVLVTDRSRVVAEIRLPRIGANAAGAYRAADVNSRARRPGPCSS